MNKFQVLTSPIWINYGMRFIGVFPDGKLRNEPAHLPNFTLNLELSGTSQLNELEDSIVKPDTGPDIAFSDSDIW